MKHVLTALFAGSVVAGNILAAKLSWFVLPGLGGVAVPAGFVALGVAYLISDLMVEFHGEAAARRMVNGTIVTLLAAYGLITLAVALPSAPFYGGQAAFASVLQQSGSISLASVVALALAQHLDIRVFGRLRAWTDGRRRWVRNCGSTALSQGVDTVVFIGLAFAVFPSLGLGGDPIWGWQLASIVVGQYVLKLAVAALDTAPFYVVTTAAEVRDDA
jgi:uncharacterized integral membrane protein (TIGR00697 family)